MKRKAWLGAVLLAVSLSTGCVERTFHITSDQPGALVYHNGVMLGHTPVDETFVFYGKHQLTLVKDGYETLNVVENVPAPWYEYPPLEFIVENLWPFQVHDRRDLQFTLPPLVREREDQVLIRAQQLQARGQSIGEPRKPAAARTGPGAPPPGAAPIPARPIILPGANPGNPAFPANPVPPPVAAGIPQSPQGTPLPGLSR